MMQHAAMAAWNYGMSEALGILHFGPLRRLLPEWPE
jgi:hypothetical protein